MGKTVFTLIFLLVSLIVAVKIQSFVKNNRPANIPITPIIDESNTIDLVNPVIYEASSSVPEATSTEASSTLQ